MNRLRVLIADDHEHARWAISDLLSPKYMIAGSVTNGRQLVDAATALHPDVIVSDVCMPLTTGPEAMRELRAKGMDIPFVLISSDSSEAAEHIREGAIAFVDKVDIGYELEPAVFAATIGQVYFSRSACSRLVAWSVKETVC
jgi:NarL family two-component system response regulator YdfI